MHRKILVVLAVLAIALAVMAVSIEAQRGGGGSRGGGSGGSGGGMHFEPNTNDNTNGNLPPYNGNFPGNYDLIEVSVATDKWRYVLDEPIRITVTGYNPANSTVVVVHTDPCMDPLVYLIDGYITRYDYVDENGTLVSGTRCAADGGAYPFQPYETLNRGYVRKTVIGNLGTGLGVGYYPALPVGRHSVVGRIELKTGGAYESDPVTIWVTEPHNGGD